MRKSVIIGGISALAIIAGTASPAFADGPPSVNSGDINATVTVQDTISMTGVGNSVPFGSGSPGDTLSVPKAITPVITVLHHGGATLSLVNSNGGFHPNIGAADAIADTAVSINGTPLNNNNPTSLQVIPTNTNAQSFAENWSLAIPATPLPGGSFTNGPLFADFSLQLVAN